MNRGLRAVSGLRLWTTDSAFQILNEPYELHELYELGSRRPHATRFLSLITFQHTEMHVMPLCRAFP